MRKIIILFICLSISCVIIAQEGLYNGDNLYIENGETFFVQGDFTNDHEDFENNGDFTLKGNLENFKLILNEGNGLLRLEGDGQQFVRLSEEFKTNNLEINNIDNAVFEDFANLSVYGDLDFTQGYLFTKVESQIVFKPGALYFYANDESHINGPATKEGNTQFTFPIGKRGKLRPLRIDGLNANNSFEAEYFASTFTDLETNSTINHVSDFEYWSFEKIFGPDAPDLTLVWDDDSFVNVVESELQIGYYNGNSWESVDASTELPEQLETDLTSIEGIEEYGNFTFASTTSSNKIDDGVMSFELIKDGCHVNIFWQTIERSGRISAFHIYKQDENNDFRIFKTISAENDDKLGQYSYIDDTVEEGEIAHYRIVTVYQDGTSISTERKFIRTTCEDISLLLYPTLLQPDDVLNLQIDSNVGKDLPISIVDELGRILYTEDLSVKEGRNNFTFDLVRFGMAEYFIWTPDDPDVETLRFQVIR